LGGGKLRQSKKRENREVRELREKWEKHDRGKGGVQKVKREKTKVNRGRDYQEEGQKGNGEREVKSHDNRLWEAPPCLVIKRYTSTSRKNRKINEGVFNNKQLTQNLEK